MAAAATGGRPTPAASPRPSALLVFTSAGESELASVRGMSVGIMSASQGQFTTAQLLLDIGQGARVASSAYPDATPPTLTLRRSGAGGLIGGWAAVLRRAGEAPQLLRPGLLAGQIPGAGAYAGVAGGDDTGAPVAADPSGRIDVASLGSVHTLLARIAALARDRRFLAADLPDGGEGLAELRTLAAARPAAELLLVIQRPRAAREGQLLWAGAAGLSDGGRELSSKTTNEQGLFGAVDLAPTILRHLGLTVPPDMRGQPLLTRGALRSASLRALMARLRVLGGRRLKALASILGAWAVLLALAARRPRSRAWAMRSGAIGVLWAPVVVLIPAALAPSAGTEFAIIALACLVLGALTDRLLPWPRAPIAPAVVVIGALVIDALAGTQLLVRSLLGPNPILGARFYGIGNELKSALAVLVLAAVAAALYPATRGRRAAVATVAAGVVLAVVEGSARIGAGVGGVILVSAAFALATVMLAPGVVTRRRALIVLLSPLLALIGLAALDLATAHGGGHFTGSILHARSASDLRDILVRRYKAAWGELRNHAMPIATLLALASGVWGVHWRKRLLSPVASDPGWLAALAGGFTAGVVGALVEDSGPVLLVVALFTLGCVATYLWGCPPARAPHAPAEQPARPAQAEARSPARLAQARSSTRPSNL